MTRVTTAELAQRMDELVAAVERGEEVSITTKSGRHLRLVTDGDRSEQLTPEEVAKRRLDGFGCMKGQIWMSPDFDDPIPGMEEYM